jgi:CRISPR-associated protein Cmr4
MSTQLTFVYALSPLHAGIGQGVGVIDLPIAREKATGLPFLPGSSLKGALRALCSDKDQCQAVFGLDVIDIPTNENNASAAQFSDQRLLLLPIRSLAGTFAWVTSPYVLRRFVRDALDAKAAPPTSIPAIQKELCSVVERTAQSQIQSKITIASNNTQTVFLEDLDLTAQSNEATTTWATWLGQKVFPNDPAWQQMLTERLCIVHDDVFNFLIDAATEITARIKLLEDSKTVQDGGLWYEEALPTETILSGIVLATPTKAAKITAEEVLQILNRLTGKTLQLGGKATVGRGLCRVQLGGA